MSASIAGQISLPWLPVYSASKFALAAHHFGPAYRIEARRRPCNGGFSRLCRTLIFRRMPPDRGRRIAWSRARDSRFRPKNARSNCRRNYTPQADGCHASLPDGCWFGPIGFSRLCRVANGTASAWISGMDNKLKRAPGVYLAGFMGSGKTTVARAARRPPGMGFHRSRRRNRSRRRDHHRADLRDPGASRNSAASKPRRSRRVMRRVERGMPSVIALGGGSFVQPANAELLEGHGISIWLDCPFETVIAADALWMPNRGRWRATASGSASSMRSAAPPTGVPTIASTPIAKSSGR